ncbi:N-acetylmuramoyl-L-alanine amidase [Planococcus beigongshangi]|uniref:N-acetylmuramoyl-L-alanine amidase n=1 Tax=Planococcus beigongshangi TaxID=2782536 RepID=UPI00193B0226|nr:N-acetylmuramoyl-L-alanine amidase [Planococcus beigongshangi]
MRKVCVLLAFLLTGGVFFSTASSVSANTVFTDIPAKAEYTEEVAYIHNLGIIKGYQENGKSLFKPQNAVTRAQAAKMLVIATGNENIQGSALSFKDVNKNLEAYSYISKAVKLGYFSGYPDGTFKPNEPLTRGQMSKVLANAFKIDEAVTSAKPLAFSDVPAGNQYASKINGLYYKGITRGDQGKFMISDSLSRAQFSMFLARALSPKFTLPVSASSQTELARGKVKLSIPGDTLNVRSTPADSSKILGELKNGAAVSVVKDHGDWVEIAYSTGPAYVHKGFIEFLDADLKPVGLATHFVKINTFELNVRNAPNASATYMGKFKNNDIIEVHGETNGWYLVLFNDMPAYISKSYTVNYNATKPVTPVTNNTVTGKVTVNSLNVRSQANATSSIVGKLNTGDKVTVLSIDGYWAKVKFGSVTGYAHKSYLKLLNNAGHILKNRIIVIDAGHGGSDPGAAKNGVMEKNIVLDVSKRVETKLKAAGANVLMTRKTDAFPSLQDRVNFARQNYAEVFVSVHVNAFSNSTAKGSEVFYNSQNANAVESKYLALDIQNKIVQYADMHYRRVADGNYHVIRNQDIPAVLVELGFLTHAPDFAKLTSSAYLDKYAQAIYDGIIEYYSAP